MLTFISGPGRQPLPVTSSVPLFTVLSPAILSLFQALHHFLTLMITVDGMVKWRVVQGLAASLHAKTLSSS